MHFLTALFRFITHANLFGDDSCFRRRETLKTRGFLPGNANLPIGEMDGCLVASGLIQRVSKRKSEYYEAVIDKWFMAGRMPALPMVRDSIFIASG